MSAAERSDTSAARPDRVGYLDDLRVLATVAVVWLHTSAPYVDAAPVGSPLFWVANAQQSAVRFAVAIFVMVSGALMLAPGPDPPLGRFFGRRFLRVGVPLIVWSLAYAGFRALYGIPFDWGGLARAFLLGSTHYHLYFLFAILGLYLWTPLLRRVLRELDAPVVAGLTGAVWLLTLYYSATTEFAGRMSDTTGSAFTKFGPFVGYYLLGHVLHGVWPRRLSLPGIVAALALGLAAMLSGTAWMMSSYGAAPPGRYLHSILSPTGLVYSVGVFLAVQYFADVSGSGERTWRRAWGYQAILGASLGIYLLHPMVLTAFAVGLHRRLAVVLPHGLDLPVIALLVLAFCTALVSALRRIPGLRWTVG